MPSRVTSEIREAVLDYVARRIVGLRGGPAVRVAIDGIDGAGKTTFADEVGEKLRAHRPVIRASVDGFHNPRKVRYRLGRWSPEGFYRDSYDYGALQTALLDPLSPGGSGRYRLAVFDVENDMPIDGPEEQAADGAVLILDGMFLHRPELRRYWDFSVLLSVAWAKNHHIPNFPEGWPTDPGDPRNRRYADGQEIYGRECRPREFAGVVINNEDLAGPFLE